MEQKKGNRLLAFLLCVAMLLTMTVSNALAEKGKPAGKIDPMVRVLLRRLNITNRMDVVLTGPYGLTSPNGTELFFDRGNTLSFRLNDGKLFLYYENMTAELGGECSLTRYRAGAGQDVGFSLTNYAAFYKADLRLKVDGEIILPIATLHVEDYLQCVVPYEMSEYFPLEALKAQKQREEKRGTLSPERLRQYERMLSFMSGHESRGSEFSAIKADFDGMVAAMRSGAAAAKEKMENMLAFAEKVWPEGQEMLILVTELTISWYAARFISRYGCESYYRHNEELMLYERHTKIISQLNLLQDL